MEIQTDSHLDFRMPMDLNLEMLMVINLEIQTDSHSDFRMGFRSATRWATPMAIQMAIQTETPRVTRRPMGSGWDSLTRSVIATGFRWETQMGFHWVTHWPMGSNWAIRTGFRLVIHWVILTGFRLDSRMAIQTHWDLKMVTQMVIQRSRQRQQHLWES